MVGYSQNHVLELGSTVEISGRLVTNNLIEIFKDENIIKEIEKSIKITSNFIEKKDTKFSVNPLLSEEVFFLLDMGLPKVFKYKIISVQIVSDDLFVFSILTQWNYSEGTYQEFTGVIKVGFHRKSNQIEFPLINKSLSEFNTNNISFKYEPEKLSTIEFKKSDVFVIGLEKSIQENYPKFKKPLKNLNYIISTNGVLNGVSYWNMDYYILTSRYFKSIYTILDFKSNGYYPHELVHYVLSEYNFNYFLSETLSTFLSGGESHNGVKINEELNEIHNRLQNDKEYSNKLNSDKIFLPENSHEMYLIGSLLLKDYNMKIGNRQFYNEIFENLNSKSNSEVLNYLKSKLDITNISDYILSYK
jgi:hypothetical protein